MEQSATSAQAPTRWRDILSAGLAAIGFSALRVAVGRWLGAAPTFASRGKLAALELRRYDAWIAACTRVEDPAIEVAIDHGYGRLAGYLCGENQTGELLARTSPILTTMRDGCYTVSCVMPPGRTLGELPRPAHPCIELRKVPACEIAALRFHGGCTRNNIAAHERMLRRQLVDTGLSTRGSIVFATFDSLATLPILRRNELWIELA